MRDTFTEYYRPGPGDEKRFAVEGAVVVDANVLLDLYRLTTAQREAVLDVLSTIGERLWIPYQVGLEYQRNRMGVIRAQASHYDRLVDLHGAKTSEDLSDALAKITVPAEVADEVRPLFDDLASRLAAATTEYIAAVEEIRDRHVVTPEDALLNDPVRERLDDLFAGRVGDRPDDKIRDERIKEAERRADALIPPGYKDGGKDTAERKAGDYLLWAELLDHAEASKSEGRPLLLVTNDVKEDWYERSGGEVVGPRIELVREFSCRSGDGYHQVTLDRLLRLANEHLSADVPEATIEKASELSQVRGDAAAAADLARINDALRRLDDQARIDYAFPDATEAARRVLQGFDASDAARRAMQNTDAAEAARRMLEGTDYSAVIRRSTQDLDTTQATRRMLKDVDFTDAARQALRNMDPGAAARRALADPQLWRAVKEARRRGLIPPDMDGEDDHRGEDELGDQPDDDTGADEA